MITIGIDPGKKYACAMFRSTAQLKTVISLTNTPKTTTNALRGVLSTIKDLSSINAWIEDVGAMAYVSIDKQTGKKTTKSQKGTSNFNFGFDTGWFYGFFASYGITLQVVKPQIWLKEFNVPSRAKPSDIPYLSIARDMFPELADQLKYKTKDHDKAAALLIAEYGRRYATDSLTGCEIVRNNTIYTFGQIERL